MQIGNAHVWGGQNVAGQMPGPASSLLAQNIVNLLTLAASEEGAWAPDFEDEIIAGACVTHAGEVRHEPTRDALADRGAAPEAPTQPAQVQPPPAQPEQTLVDQTPPEQAQPEQEGTDS